MRYGFNMTEPLDINSLMANLGIQTRDVQTVRSNCSYCGKKFSWTKKGDGPVASKVYCSDKCIDLMNTEKRRKQEARNKSRNSVKPIVCWFPKKMLFPNAESAWAFIDETFPEDTKMQAYRCNCGGVHIGHPNENDVKANSKTRAIPRTESKLVDAS